MDVWWPLTVFRAQFFIFLLELMDSSHVMCSLTSKETNFSVTDASWHLTTKGPTFCVSSLGSDYHAEVKMISKALLYVCKHKAAHHTITVGSEHSEGEGNSKAAAVSPDLSQTHSQECSLLSCCVLHFTVMFMPNNFFLTKCKKGSKKKCWVKKRV